MRVEQLIRDGAARYGSRTAVVAGRVAYSYAELDLKSDRLAAALAARGVRHGDGIAVFLNAGFPSAVTTFGVLKAGAILCPVEAGSDAGSLAKILGDRAAVGIVTEARLALKAASAICQAPPVKFVVLVGGGERTVLARNCISFEDAIRIEERPVASPDGDDDVAIKLGLASADGQDSVVSLSHADVFAALSSADDYGVDEVGASMSPLADFCRLAGAIRAGVTKVLDPPAKGSVVATAGISVRELQLALTW